MQFNIQHLIVAKVLQFYCSFYRVKVNIFNWFQKIANNLLFLLHIPHLTFVWQVDEQP